MKPPEPADQPDAAALAEIERAQTLAFGGVGFAGLITPETAAYRALGEAIGGGADLRDELRRLVGQATPAGRIYAAELLAQDDPEAAAALWQSLRADDSEVDTMAGCMMNRTTVAEYAAGKQEPVS